MQAAPCPVIAKTDEPVGDHTVNASVLHTGTAGLYVDVKIGVRKVNLVIDTGSSVTLLSSKTKRKKTCASSSW